MSKNAGTSTVKTSIDPASQRYVDQMRERAMGQASDPRYGQIADRFGQLANLGLTGAQAFTDPAMAQQFMNPYLSQMNPIFDEMRQRAIMGANEQATAAGAFGGSRHGVMAGQEAAGIGQQQAAFNVQAFNDAMSRAGQLANLGFGAGQAQIGAMGAPLSIMQGGLGPTGTVEEQKMYQDWLSGLLGAGLTAASFIPGPWQIPAAAAQAYRGTGRG